MIARADQGTVPRSRRLGLGRFRLRYAPTDDRSRGLTRGLGAWTGAAVIVGTMIGTGIFLMPSEVARSTGSVRLALLAWVVGGALSLFGAMSYVELGASLPDAGADYTWLSRARLPLLGYLYGWRGFILSTPASMASYAAAIALFSSYLWPSLAQPIARAGPVDLTVGKLLALGLIVAITVLNFLSVRVVGRFQLVLSAFKALTLVAVIAAGLTAVGRPKPAGAEVLLEQATYAGFLGALTAVLWAYSGWHGLLRLGSEIRDPARTVPRAMFGGFGFTAILFLLVNLACFAALGFGGVAGTSTPVSDALERTLGANAADWLTLTMIVSVMGTMNANLLSAARVPYAMAQDGYFSKSLAGLGPNSRAPVVSVAVPALVATVLVTTGSFREISAFVVFLQWSFYALGMLALFRLRRLEPELPRPVRAWGYPIVPATFMFMAATLTVYLVLSDPVRSGLGVGLVLLGLFFYRRRPLAQLG